MSDHDCEEHGNFDTAKKDLDPAIDLEWLLLEVSQDRGGGTKGRIIPQFQTC
jgi:hypothetical protein